MKSDDVVPEEIACELPEDGHEEAPREMNAVLREWNTQRTRLYLLRGLPCPLCRRSRRTPVPELLWTGISLACPQGHGWSNPDALRADMVGRPELRRRGRSARP